jgi:CRP-like cAMP-binding protein
MIPHVVNSHYLNFQVKILLVLKRLLEKIMKHILLVGDWSGQCQMLGMFLSAGCMISLFPEGATGFVSCDLIVARLAKEADLEGIEGMAGAWLAWCTVDDKALANLAYQKGASAVFSKDTPENIIVQVAQRNLERLNSPYSQAMENVIQRRYQRGDVILLEQDTVLEIQQGILAQTMVHQDGTEILLGLVGPRQVVLPHPADTCFIQLISHTNSVVSIQSWERAYRDADFPMKLSARLRQMEGWAAMQARPHLDQRVIGILSLLAEQFGVSTPEGRMIDVRITHMQLSSAVGATRTTITRTLGDLRRQGVLSLAETADGERYCLTRWEHNHHALRVGSVCACGLIEPMS